MNKVARAVVVAAALVLNVCASPAGRPLPGGGDPRGESSPWVENGHWLDITIYA